MIERILNKLLREYNRFRWGHFQLKRELEPNNVMTIVGDPRGGTTWLAEIIQSIPKTEILWEPLLLEREPTFKNLNFSYRQFISENASEPKIKASFEKLFSGKILNSYLCQFTKPMEIKNCSQLVVKFCRANQLLPWLTHEFNFNYLPLYIVRHPCAVVASQLKKGGWDKVSNQFEIPYDKPYSEFYTQHESYLLSLDTKIKKLAATWCLCNSVPLNHNENNKKWITITYESLIMDGIQQLKRIEDKWRIEFPESAFSKLNKASTSTVKGSPILDGKGSQLKYWQKQLSEKQINEIREVLNYFKIHLYNVNSPLPTISFQ
ncbi:hypothetical protein [Marivirga harenae]|uniref:hypothetical protein n=1 Tax=Marivirga harenae TaxID=2010992 RepID=UPI0026DEC68B|nr:hypothetical protein [Marivirga harenae]WKV13430.1 hypothetical protein Q3Y49_06275 [Marivirga harenae]